MTASKVAAEALRQVWEGDDFTPASKVLSRVKPDLACLLPPGFAYSLATLVLHTDFWQRIWLARLMDTPRPDMTKDWRVVEPGEWDSVRRSFLEGFEKALQIAAAVPFAHKMKSDEAAIKTLLNIAVHNAYHIGQFRIVKRAATAAMKGADPDSD